MRVRVMATRGRPAKVFSTADFDHLRIFLQQLPYLKKVQEKARNLLQNQTDNFDDQQLKIIKLADREKTLFLKRQTLLEQIKIKEKNQQKLLGNEVEILKLANQQQDRDTYFRLDRALESYQKIQKAVQDDRIRFENERRREVLNKSRKPLTEAQKRRNEENRRKYELGGAVFAAFKKLNINIDSDTPKQVQNRIVNNYQFVLKMRNTQIFKEIIVQQKNWFKQRDLFFDVIEGLSTWKSNGEPLSSIEIEKHKDKYNK